MCCGQYGKASAFEGGMRQAGSLWLVSVSAHLLSVPSHCGVAHPGSDHSCEDDRVTTESGASEDWMIVLPPGPLAEVKLRLHAWRVEHPEIADDDIRVDLIRTAGRDEMRVLVRRSLSAPRSGPGRVRVPHDA